MSELLKKIRMRTWAEIDLDNLEYNFNMLKTVIGDHVKLCCVVKADGYGHSAPRVAHLLEELGCDSLAVSNIEEALQLRKSGVGLPIIILGYTPTECAETLANNNITQCVYSYDYGTSLAENAKACGVKVKIHVKLDTGMGRIGFVYRNDDTSELDEALLICRNESLIAEGLFTHFAMADEENGVDYTSAQFSEFCQAIDYFRKNGISFDVCHCANSAASLKYPEYRMDMVRVGIALYGLTSFNTKAPTLKPVMSLKSVVSHVKVLKAGESVSYGRRFTAEHDMRVATVPVGYADGFMRSTSKSSYTLKVNGKNAKILGSICMDQLILDVSDIECKTGDTVTIFGGNTPHTASDLALANGTIPYEILCSVGKRVPRAFLKDGKIVDWSDDIYE